MDFGTSITGLLKTVAGQIFLSKDLVTAFRQISDLAQNQTNFVKIC